MVKKATAAEKPAKPPVAEKPVEPPVDKPVVTPPELKAEKPVKSTLPEQVTLAGLYGFYDDEDTFHSWAEGHVVTDPAHIELLIARGAPLAE